MPGPIFWPPTGYEIGFAVGRLMVASAPIKPSPGDPAVVILDAGVIVARDIYGKALP